MDKYRRNSFKTHIVNEIAERYFEFENIPPKCELILKGTNTTVSSEGIHTALWFYLLHHDSYGRVVTPGESVYCKEIR